MPRVQGADSGTSEWPYRETATGAEEKNSRAGAFDPSAQRLLRSGSFRNCLVRKEVYREMVKRRYYRCRVGSIDWRYSRSSVGGFLQQIIRGGSVINAV